MFIKYYRKIGDVDIGDPLKHPMWGALDGLSESLVERMLIHLQLWEVETHFLWWLRFISFIM